MISNDDEGPVQNDKLVSAFCALRESVLDRWRVRVAAEIPAAASLADPLLVNMVPTLYDNIANALSSDVPVKLAIAGTNLASVHGR